MNAGLNRQQTISRCEDSGITKKFTGVAGRVEFEVNVAGGNPVILNVIHQRRTLVLGGMLSRKQIMLLAVLFALATVAVAGARELLMAYQRVPAGLQYDGTRDFDIGKRHVTIETRSISLGNGDDGDAEIIVSSGGDSTNVASKFSDDNWRFVKPAYISWRDVDDHAGRDLLIWIPSFSTTGPLKAAQYISSRDGKLHTLQVPLERPIPGY